jgi:coenzyme F420-dependent glucose-6-phosphate dehydrogenase
LEAHTGGHAPFSFAWLGALALSSQEKVGVEDPLAMERLADALPTEPTASRRIVSTDAPRECCRW